MQINKKFSLFINIPPRPSATQSKRFVLGLIPPSAFGHSPRWGEKIYIALGFFAPSGRAERKETARWAVLAKEPACRFGREAAEGINNHNKFLFS
jgi:hypothetical protein